MMIFVLKSCYSLLFLDLADFTRQIILSIDQVLNKELSPPESGLNAVR